MSDVDRSYSVFSDVDGTLIMFDFPHCRLVRLSAQATSVRI